MSKQYSGLTTLGLRITRPILGTGKLVGTEAKVSIGLTGCNLVRCFSYFNTVDFNSKQNFVCCTNVQLLSGH